jgi:3-deoxy-D-manno-octulosonic acid kinase
MVRPVAQVPHGYVIHRIGETWLVLDREHSEALVQLRLGEPSARRAIFARAPRRGRGRAPSLSVSRDLSVVLRRYRHGGLFGGLLGNLFWGPSRALAELDVTARAEAAGAPVPHVVCLAAWRVAGPLWSALIGTEEIAASVDLFEALRALPHGRQRLALVREVGRAVRRLHDAGVEHRDLQLRNVLVAEPPAKKIVVVDLDGARFRAGIPLGPRRRAKNLGRLVRSAVKLGLWEARRGRRELAALFGAYSGTDRELRRELRRWASWERLKLWLHRRSYTLRRTQSLAAASPPRAA